MYTGHLCMIHVIYYARALYMAYIILIYIYTHDDGYMFELR